MLYLLLKFLHIIGSIVWIGGNFVILILSIRLARTKDQHVFSAYAQEGGFLGGAVMAPAAAITLLSGIVMIVQSGYTFHTFWVAWGLIGLLISWFILGATIIRKAGIRLYQLIQETGIDNPLVTHLQKRISLLAALNLILLTSIVWMMVFKPTF